MIFIRHNMNWIELPI